MSTKANARFAAASGSVDTSSTGTGAGTDTALGFKLYGQAVAAAAAEDASSGSTPLTDRLEAMLASPESVGDNLVAAFDFAVGDQIHMNAKFTVSSTESPDSSGDNEASSYLYRLVVNIV